MQSPLPLGSHLFFLLLQCHLHFHLFSCHLHRTDVPFQECQIRHIRSPAMQVPVQTASIQLGSAGQIRLLSGILLRSFQKFRRKLQLLHSFLMQSLKMQEEQLRLQNQLKQRLCGKLGTNPVCKYKKTPAQTISETKQIVKLTSFQRSSSVYNFYTIFQ